VAIVGRRSGKIEKNMEKRRLTFRSSCCPNREAENKKCICHDHHFQKNENIPFENWPKDYQHLSLTSFQNGSEAKDGSVHLAEWANVVALFCPFSLFLDHEESTLRILALIVLPVLTFQSTSIHIKSSANNSSNKSQAEIIVITNTNMRNLL
jgi:hypothetical protein